MKCLSVREPWATLIIRGIKQIELRPWRTRYCGVLCIHASLRLSQELLDPRCGVLEREVLEIAGEEYPKTRGRIVGIVVVKGCRPSTPGDYQDALCTPSAKDFSLLLESPVTLANPVLHKGRLGVHSLPDEVRRSVAVQISERVPSVP